MNTKKRVLIFSTAYFPFVGGAEVAVKEITNRLGSDFDFDLITLNLDGNQKKQEKIGNVKIYRILYKGKFAKLFFSFVAYKYAVKLHKKNQYDIVWSIMASFGGFSARFFKKKFPKIPFLLTLQEGDPIPEIKRKVFFVYPWFKQIFTLADHVQVISNYLGEWAKDMGAKKISVIPNGVDIKKFTNNSYLIDRKGVIRKEMGLKESDVVLITTSRLVKKNGVSDIIESLIFLPENIKLLILGVGDLENKLKEKVKSLNLSERVTFLGFQDSTKVIAYLHGSDIFIRPSISEGMGNSFIEAMATKIPVIATPVGGIVDFLRDGETGFFCEVNNPKSIASVVKKIIENKELVERVKQNAFEMVKEKYDWEVVSKDIGVILKNI